jgi:hypothetical protein
MDLFRNCLNGITENYVHETQNRENFVFPAPDLKKDEMKMFTPVFNAFDIKPEEAVNVMLDFDKEPAKLTPAGIKNRIKLLSLFNYMLDDKDLMQFISQGSGADLASENMKGTINLLKRLSVLLILEAKFASDDSSDSAIMESFDAINTAITKAPTMTPSSMQAKDAEFKSPAVVKETQSVKNITGKIKRNAKMIKNCKMAIVLLLIVIVVLAFLLLKKSQKAE